MKELITIENKSANPFNHTKPHLTINKQMKDLLFVKIQDIEISIFLTLEYITRRERMI